MMNGRQAIMQRFFWQGRMDIIILPLTAMATVTMHAVRIPHGMRLGRSGRRNVPLKSFDAGIEQNNRIRGLFYRARPSRGQERTVHSSWGGGKVHSFDTFGELVFALE